MAPSKEQPASVTWTWARLKLKVKWVRVCYQKIAEWSQKFPYRTRIASLSSICGNIGLQPLMQCLNLSKLTRMEGKRRLMLKTILFRESMQHRRSLKDRLLRTRSGTNKPSLNIFLQKRLRWRIYRDKIRYNLGRGNRALTNNRKNNSSLSLTQMIKLRVAVTTQGTRTRITCRFRNRSVRWWGPMWMWNQTILISIPWGN